MYDALFAIASGAINVRRVWPTRADEIVARGRSGYWRAVGVDQPADTQHHRSLDGRRQYFIGTKSAADPSWGITMNRLSYSVSPIVT